MRAVVLVGGEGTRLRPLTYSSPKQMLPVAQLPMIERVLEQLARHGVDDAVLSLGYRPELFVDHFSSGRWRNVSLTFAIEPPTLLDTAGAIAFAARAANIQETFVAVNGDVLADLDVTELVDFHVSRKAEATISLTPVEDPSSFGVVPTDSEGRVEAFIEKPQGKAPTNLINAGTYVLEPSVIDRIPEGERVSIERKVFPELANEKSLFALGSDAYWLDTGTAEKFVQANIDYLRNMRPLPPHPDAAESEGNWIIGSSQLDGSVSESLIGDGAEISAGATVKRSVIGRGVKIEAGATITDAVILDGAYIGEKVTISESVLGENAKVHTGARIDEFSILGFNDEAAAESTIHAQRVGVE